MSDTPALLAASELVATAELLRRGRVGPGLEHLEQFRASAAGPGPGSARPAGVQLAETVRSLDEQGDQLAARMLHLAWARPAIGAVIQRWNAASASGPAALLVFLLRLKASRSWRELRTELTADEQVTLQAIIDLRLFGGLVLETSPITAQMIIATGVCFFLGVAAVTTVPTGRVAAAAIAVLLVWLAIAGGRAKRRLADAGALRTADVVPTTRPRSPFPTAMLRKTIVVERPRWQASAALAVILGFAGVAIATIRPLSVGVVLGAAAFVVAAAAIAAGTYRTRLVVDEDGIADHRLLRTRRIAWRDIYVARNLDLEKADDPSLVVVDHRGRERTLVRGGALARRQLVAAAVNQRAAADYPGPKAVDAGPRFVLAGMMIFLGCIAAIAVLIFVFDTPTRAVDPASLPPGRVYWTVASSNGIVHHWIDCPSLVEWIGGTEDELCVESARTAAIGLPISVIAALGLLGGGIGLVRFARRPNRRHRSDQRTPPGPVPTEVLRDG